MKETIEVQYSCKMCAVIRRKLNVPVRGDEDVKEWMDATVLLIAKDHAVSAVSRTGKFCPNTRLDELWIPLPKDADENTKIGSVRK